MKGEKKVGRGKGKGLKQKMKEILINDKLNTHNL